MNSVFYTQERHILVNPALSRAERREKEHNLGNRIISPRERSDTRERIRAIFEDRSNLPERGKLHIFFRWSEGIHFETPAYRESSFPGHSVEGRGFIEGGERD